MRINLTVVCLNLILFLAAVPYSVQPVCAQSFSTVIQGSFTLPFEVQWQGRSLPAGEYHFILSSYSSGNLLTIRDTKENTIARVSPVGFSGASPRQNALKVVTLHGKRYIQTLSLNSLNTELQYFVPKQSADERDATIVALSIPIKNQAR